jgi:methylenetetrahydrofolate dehydrogenase (NADP+)/methenyltetrahydrofolate cyclohydrolase
MAKVIDGKAVAAGVIEQVTAASNALEAQTGARPGLAVVIVGDDPASHVYVSSKSRMAKQCGFKSVQHTLPLETTQAELEALVARLNEDREIHGILVQLPLPDHLQSDPVIQSIRPEKDVDGLHIVNAGKLMTGDLEGGLISCTPAGAMLFVRQTHGPDLSGLNAVVIGRSNLFGKPMAALLLAANATVTTAPIRAPRIFPASAATPISWSPPSAGRGWSRPTGSSPAPPSSMSASTASTRPSGAKARPGWSATSPLTNAPKWQP